AVDATKTLTIAGGVGGGFVGVAGGVDIGTLDQTVQSAIGSNSTVYAKNDVDVFALSRKDVQTYALSIGGGFVGVAGSVTDWSIGEQSTTSYQDDGGGQTKGDWSSGTQYGKGDVVTFGGQKYSAAQTTADTSTDPSANHTDWTHVETKHPLQSSGGNATSDSDSVAKGDGGYKDGLNGASVRDAGTWTSGTIYKQGEVVAFGGHKYVGRETTNGSRKTQDPTVNTGDWQLYNSSASADKTNDRMSSGLANAMTGIGGAAPTSGPTASATGGLRPLSLGTTATVNGAIRAGGSANVRAMDDTKAQSLAGALAGGFVGVSAAVAIFSIKSNVEASVSSTRSEER